jgi:hypothetical protein
MKKKNIQITESQFENIVKKLMVETSARYVMFPDEFMKQKNMSQQYHSYFENKCFIVHDGNHQIDVDDKFMEKHKIPNGIGGTIYHDAKNIYFCPDFGDDRPQRTIQIF